MPQCCCPTAKLLVQAGEGEVSVPKLRIQPQSVPICSHCLGPLPPLFQSGTQVESRCRIAGSAAECHAIMLDRFRCLSSQLEQATQIHVCVPKRRVEHERLGVGMVGPVRIEQF